MSRVELAHRLGCHYKTLCYRFTVGGDTAWSPMDVTDLAYLFRVDPAYLLGITEVPDGAGEVQLGLLRSAAELRELAEDLQRRALQVERLAQSSDSTLAQTSA